MPIAIGSVEFYVCTSLILELYENKIQKRVIFFLLFIFPSFSFLLVSSPGFFLLANAACSRALPAAASAPVAAAGRPPHLVTPVRAGCLRPPSSSAIPCRRVAPAASRSTAPRRRPPPTASCCAAPCHRPAPAISRWTVPRRRPSGRTIRRIKTASMLLG